MPSTRRVPPAAVPRGHLSLPATLLVAACLGYLVSFVSANLHPRFEHRAETVAEQEALLHRDTFQPGDAPRIPAAWRNRILIPAAMALGTATGFGTPGQWFLLARLVSAIAMFFVVLRSSNHGHAAWTLTGAALIAYLCILSFNQVWELPFEFIDVAVMAAACALARSGRWVSLCLVSILGALNRESAAFAGVIWISVRGLRDDRSVDAWELLRGASVSLLAFATVMFLRHYFAPGSGQGYGWVYLPDLLRRYAGNITPYGWVPLFVAMVVPIVALAIHVWPILESTELRLLGAAAGIFAVTLVFGIADELRIFLDPFTVTVYALISGASRLPGAAEQP